MADLLVRDVRVLGADPAAVTIRAGRVETVGPAPEGWTGPVVDGGGRLALPGLVDGHAHIDGTLWGQPWRPHASAPGLQGLIDGERALKHDLPPTAERAAALLGAYVENGTTVLRTHVDVDTEHGLAPLEAVLGLAEAWADRIAVEVVAFPQSGILVRPGTADLLDAAVRAGAAHVGGLDPAGFDGDAVTHLDTVFAIADRHGVGVDVHLHDRGSLGRYELGLVVERTLALGLAGRVVVSHAFCLADGSAAADALLDRIAGAGIALATVAPGDVEPLPFARIAELGIGLCLGQDGIRDAWSPWGDADMLARAGLMAWRAGHRRDEDIAACVAVATTRGAAAIGVADHALVPGGRGDLVLVDAPTVAAAAVDRPPRALVVTAGRPVAGPLTPEL